jgi:hypothetical protein
MMRLMLMMSDHMQTYSSDVIGSRPLQTSPQTGRTTTMRTEHSTLTFRNAKSTERDQRQEPQPGHGCVATRSEGLWCSYYMSLSLATCCFLRINSLPAILRFVSVRCCVWGDRRHVCLSVCMWRCWSSRLCRAGCQSVGLGGTVGGVWLGGGIASTCVVMHSTSLFFALPARGLSLMCFRV